MSHTPILDALTDVVAGSRNVRRGQERASARLYAGLDRKMKAVHDISPEMTELSPTSSRQSFSNPSLQSRPQLLHRTSSYQQQPQPNASPRGSRVELHRCQSDLLISSYINKNQPLSLSRVPTAESLAGQTQQDHARGDTMVSAYSNLPFPALAETTGFARYRVAVNADPEWKIEHFRKQIGDLGHMVSSLDMAGMTGMSKEEWENVAQLSSARRDSIVSSRSRSSRTTTSCDAPEQFVDPLTGTRVTRGFSPSSISSARSSFKEGQARFCKSSSLSMTTSFRADSDSLQNDDPPMSYLSLPLERTPSNPLSTIAEFQSSEQLARKIQKPCEFPTSGDPDSAVASDAEDEEEDAWTDVVDPQTNKVSSITQMIQKGRTSEGQAELRKTRTSSSEGKRGRGSTTSLNRSSTLRTLRPLAQRRRSSRSTATTQDKSRPSEKKYEKKEKGQVHCNVHVPQIDGSDHFSDPGELDDDPFNEDCSTLQENSDSFTTETAEKATITENGTKVVPLVQRHRSATALFCRPDVLKK